MPKRVLTKTNSRKVQINQDHKVSLKGQDGEQCSCCENFDPLENAYLYTRCCVSEAYQPDGLGYNKPWHIWITRSRLEELTRELACRPFPNGPVDLSVIKIGGTCFRRIAISQTVGRLFELGYNNRLLSPSTNVSCPVPQPWEISGTTSVADPCEWQDCGGACCRNCCLTFWMLNNPCGTENNPRNDCYGCYATIEDIDWQYICAERDGAGADLCCNYTCCNLGQITRSTNYIFQREKRWRKIGNYCLDPNSYPSTGTWTSTWESQYEKESTYLYRASQNRCCPRLYSQLVTDADSQYSMIEKIHYRTRRCGTPPDIGPECSDRTLGCEDNWQEVDLGEEILDSANTNDATTYSCEQREAGIPEPAGHPSGITWKLFGFNYSCGCGNPRYSPCLDAYGVPYVYSPSGRIVEYDDRQQALANGTNALVIIKSWAEDGPRCTGGSSQFRFESYSLLNLGFLRHTNPDASYYEDETFMCMNYGMRESRETLNVENLGGGEYCDGGECGRYRAGTICPTCEPEECDWDPMPTCTDYIYGCQGQSGKYCVDRSVPTGGRGSPIKIPPTDVEVEYNMRLAAELGVSYEAFVSNTIQPSSQPQSQINALDML